MNIELSKENVEKWLLKYNNDQNIRGLRDTYNHPSFFEMMDKDRSETVHSAFLRWLLQGADFNVDKDYSPLMFFLDLLIRRASEQNFRFDQDLKNAILSRNIVFNSIVAETEKNVGCLAEAVGSWAEKNKPKGFSKNIEDLKKVAENRKDKLDIFIECNVENVTEKCKKLQIIIENKVGSTEGQEKELDGKEKTNVAVYDEKKQTERYYYACSYEEKNEEIKQLFVYLTPLSSIYLDDFSTLKADYKCSCQKNYIQINYQDILDQIITPLVDSPSITARSRVLLEEYINTLTIPAEALADDVTEGKKAINALKKYLVMASTSNEKDKLIKYLGEHTDLLQSSLYVSNSCICDENGQRYVFAIFLNELQKKCKDQDDTYVQAQVEKWNKSFREPMHLIKAGKNAKSLTTKLGLSETPYKFHSKITDKDTKQIDFSKKAIELEFPQIKLLLDFYQKNYRLIIAAMKILVDTESEKEDFGKWQDIYDQLTTTADHTKYSLTIKNNLIGKNLSKRELVRKTIDTLSEEGILNEELIKEMNDKIKGIMFKTKDATFDSSRYDGLKEIGKKLEYPLPENFSKDDYQYFVNNQWWVLPNKKGTLDKFLDFFSNNTQYSVEIKAMK